MDTCTFQIDESKTVGQNLVQLYKVLFDVCYHMMPLDLYENLIGPVCDDLLGDEKLLMGMTCMAYPYHADIATQNFKVLAKVVKDVENRVPSYLLQLVNGQTQEMIQTTSRGVDDVTARLKGEIQHHHCTLVVDMLLVIVDFLQETVDS